MKAVCAECLTRQSIVNLTRVIDRRTGEARYVCRPTLNAPCFSRNRRRQVTANHRPVVRHDAFFFTGPTSARLAPR